MKKTTFLPFILLPTFLIFAQNKDFKNYNQPLAGTQITIEMLPIKGGSFQFGSPATERGRSKDEGPVHEVNIAPLWMSKYEISWDLYQLFMNREIDALKMTSQKGKEVSTDIDAVSGATTPYVEMSFGMGTDGYPAICMTQLAASKFCEWLSAITGNYYRLPTEAEWEYACRANTKTVYSFGNDASRLKEYAWYIDNSNGLYHKIGTKKPNPWGLYDMHGNVAEWTLDQYIPEAYKRQKGSKSKNPFEIPTKKYPRSVRGGSWLDEAISLRSASRRGSSKIWKIRDPQIPKSKWWHTDASFVGFRIIRPYNTPNIKDRQKFWIQE